MHYKIINNAKYESQKYTVKKLKVHNLNIKSAPCTMVIEVHNLDTKIIDQSANFES